LADIVESVGPVYHDATATEDQRRFIVVETIIGAALWYLPVPEKCWTGKVSVEAITAIIRTLETLETRTQNSQQITNIQERSPRPIYLRGTQERHKPKK
jgi:hypothetical protein